MNTFHILSLQERLFGYKISWRAGYWGETPRPGTGFVLFLALTSA